MSESRFLKLVIIGLLLLNAGTLGYLFFQDRRHAEAGGGDHPMHRGGPGGPARYLRESLQLTDVQEAQYRDMRDEHHENVVHIRRGIRESHRNLYGLLHDGYQPTDSAAAIPFVDSFARAQRQIEWITFAHFRDLWAICTPSQQQKFDSVINDALEQLR